jgi:hypothetical protein
MAAGELFEASELKQCRISLTPEERRDAAGNIIKLVRCGIKYFYTLREAAAILHCSYDEILTIIADYRLDVVLFLSAYRVPWYGLCEYLMDWDDDLEEALDEYLRSIARRTLDENKPA